MQDYVYYSKYARYNKEEKRRETWGEAVDRVLNMHLTKYAAFPEVHEDIKWAFNAVRQKRVLGSQRALQFGGDPILKKSERIYNCVSSYCDRPRFFQECLYWLLCGSGAGFSVQKHHINKLPEFYSTSNRKKKTYLIPDTIEGWADALGVLLATYMPSDDFPEWEGCQVEFDYSLIRPEGSPLSSGAGKAPGPEPLRKALEIIRVLLNRCVDAGQTRLRPIDAYDIIMHASDAVLSGGIRRSATLCIFSPDDEEMIKAKTGNWRAENPQRGRSNNSALLLRNKTSKETFLNLISSVKEYGEPGFIWAEDTESLYNPCVEINLFGYDEYGNSGWQACNLCEINGGKIKCKEDFMIAARAAAIIGTLQAGYTTFPYLGKVTENIVRREALLGVSLTGMMDNPDIIFDPEIQQEMARLVIKVNEEIAKKININPAARTTCVKPAGTTSLVLGTASGIHCHHARIYFRTIQGNQLEPVLQYFKQFNPSAVEKSVWSSNNTDEIITFCVEVGKGAKVKNDLSAIDLLEHVKLTQQNWVAAGKVASRCVKPWLSHNVSNTVNVRENEWEEVADYIYKNRQFFAGISLMPASGDLDYPQAPMCNVLNPREILQEYGDGALMASGLIVDGLHAFKDLWVACDAVLGLGKELIEPKMPTTTADGIMDFAEHQRWEQKQEAWNLKQDWIRRVKQFADRYCEGNLRKCCYLLKHVNNWKKWLDLNREYKDIDYTLFHEEEDETKPLDTVACAGGSCSLF